MKFKTLFTRSVIVFASINWELCYAQTHLNDSLETILNTQIHDSTRISILLTLGGNYFNINPDKTLEYGKRALEISNSYDDVSDKARSIKLIGDGYLGLNNYEEAIKYYQLALPIIDSLGDLSLAGRIMNNLGIIQNYRGEYDESIGNFQRALKIKETLSDSSGMAFTYNNIGYLYQNIGNDIEALDFYMKAKDILERTKNYGNLAGNLGNIGGIYAKLKDNTKALEYYFLAEDLIKSVDYNRMLPELYNHISMAYFDMDSLERAEGYLELSMKIAFENNDKLGKATNYHSFGQLYKSQNRFEEARSSFEAALKIYEELGDKLMIAQTANQLSFCFMELDSLDESKKYFEKSLLLAQSLSSESLNADLNWTQCHYYEKIGDYKKALFHFMEYSAIHDSVNSQYEIQQIVQLQKKYEKEHQTVDQLQKERILNKAELEVKEATIQKQRIFQISIFFGFVFLLIILYLLLNKYRQKKIMNSILMDEKIIIAEKNKELESARNEIAKVNNNLEAEIDKRTKLLQNTVSELEAYTHSVSHDLQTPIRRLANISQLLLMDYKGRLDEEGANYIQLIDDTAIHMHKLIKNLLEFSKINKKEVRCEEIDMEEMANELKDLELAHDTDNKVQITVNRLPNAYGDSDMIRVVWSNLIGNAIKFSSKKPDPKIEIGYDTNKSSFYVKDNGAGFNMKYYDKIFKPFTRLHKASDFDGTGVGLSMVQRIIEKHGGEIWADSKKDEFATFNFTIKTNNTDEANGTDP